MNEQNAKRARELTDAGVEYLEGIDAEEDDYEPLDPCLTVEVVTSRAVLFRIEEGGDDNVANAELDDGEPGVFIPKSVLRVDEPEAVIKRKFVDDKNLWGLVE